MSEFITEWMPDAHLYKEPIVRCRDCKWLDHRNLYLCMLPDGDGEYACWVVEPDGFCAWGVKKEVGAHFWRCECGAENYGFKTCQYCGRSERC